MAEEYWYSDLVREAIIKTKPDLEQRMQLGDFVEELYSRFIISNLQRDQIKTYTERKGMIYASGKLLEMVINAEVQVPGFLNVLKEKCPLEHKAIEEGVEKFKSGEWVLPGLKRKKLFFK